MCPHKRAFVLSDGLIGDDLAADKLWVSCPLHKRNYELKGPGAGGCANDSAVNIAVFEAQEREDGMVYVKLPPVEELDALLGTERWKTRKEDEKSPFVGLDQKMKLKGRKVEGASHLENGMGEAKAARMILAGGERGAGGLDW